MANEKEKDKKALVILPIVLAGGLAYYFWRRSVGAEPPPPPPDKATLFGVVTDAVTGQAIPGVNVDCDGPAAAYSAITASNGMYQLQNIEPGTYEVVFTKAGYDPALF